MKYYHSSSSLFDFPDYEQMHNNRTGHANGALGLWCGSDDWCISKFGGLYGYELEVDYSDENVYDMEIEELSDLGGDGDYSEKEHVKIFTELHDYYLNKGIKIIRIIEGNQESRMAVILDFSLIKNISLIKK